MNNDAIWGRALNEIPISDHEYIYVADETGGAYVVTRAEIVALSDLTRYPDPDGYSIWCTEAGREATAAEIAAAMRRAEADGVTLGDEWQRASAKAVLNDRET